MDNKTHFIKWAESGRCPSEACDDPEGSWLRVESYLNQQDEEDRAFLLEKGWQYIWGIIETFVI